MCWLCENPGATRADYLAHLRDLIVRHGWIVQGVERDGPHPPWSYTAGLTEPGLPEKASRLAICPPSRKRSSTAGCCG